MRTLGEATPPTKPTGVISTRELRPRDSSKDPTSTSTDVGSLHFGAISNIDQMDFAIFKSFAENCNLEIRCHLSFS
jgi:hypothetical protein